jgi:hypothetical protein
MNSVLIINKHYIRIRVPSLHYIGARNYEYIASNERMIDSWWIGKDLEGSVRGLIEIQSWYIPEETEENHKKTAGRTPSVLAETLPGYKSRQQAS